MPDSSNVSSAYDNLKPNSCQGCPYFDQPGPVWGEGHPQARMALVQAQPSSTGGNLRVLDNACRKQDINRSREFTTTLVKCKPNTAFVHPLAIKKCAPLLQQELDHLPNLRVIVAVGAVPFKALSGGKDLTSVMNRKKSTVWLRGCPLVKGRHTIIPVMEPEFYMRTGFITSYQLDMDFQKIARFANGQGRTYAVRYNANPSTAEINELVSDLRRLGRGGVDIETPEDSDEDELRAGGLPLPIDVIGISSTIGEAVGVAPDQYELLRDLFTNPTYPVKWYVFNGSFDFYHLGKRFGKLSAVRQFDAMLALNRWRSDLMKKDLGILMSFFTDMPYTKNLAKLEPIKYQWADVTGILEGGMNIEACLDIQGRLTNVMEQDHPLHEDLLDPSKDGLNRMRELGIHADVREVMKFIKVSEQMLAKYLTVWNKHFPLVDWQSPQQLLTLFTQVFKLPTIMRQRIKKLEDGTKSRTKSPTCDSEALEEYRDVHQNKTAGLILAMREMKHLGDFAGIVAPDRRIHTAYLIHRQLQFRIQAVEPNIQQLPEELGQFKTRRMVIPDDPDQDLIISIDASQIELRIYAYLAKAKGLLAAMAKDIYIYGFMYEQIYKKPFFKVGQPKTKYAKESYVTPQEILAAKSGPLGFIYDRGADSLVQKLGMAPTLAREVHGAFHRENPEIREFHSRCIAEVTRLGYQDNLWGGRRYFYNPKVQRNEIYSFHGQSNGAELLRDHYLKPCFRHLPEFGSSRVLLTVHDSMAINVKGGLLDRTRLRTVAQFLYDSAEAPIVQMDGFVIPAEVKFGPNWGDMELFKTHKDPHGRTVVDAC